MIDRSGVFLALAAASVLVPATFIVAIVVAAVQRWRGLDVGPRFNALLALLGAASLGTLVLFLPDPVVAAPILGATALLVILSWRGRRRVQAGWIVIGAALPWTALWTVYLIALAAGARFEPGATWQGFLLGAVPLAAGLVIAARGDADSTQRAGTVEAKRSGRTFHDVSTAIGALDMLGPFRLPSLAALVALVASWIVIPLALGPFVPAPVPFILAAGISSLAATEAFIRIRTPTARRAFEAFSWLGEWELARFREATGGRVPVTRGRAQRWLATHPDRPEIRGFRVEILVVAGRYDEARATIAELPAPDPVAAFDRASLQDLVDWFSGGEGDLVALEEAAALVLPENGDVRLRAEVAVAVARVRRLMADGRRTPGDAAEPLLEVRRRLGARADGQLGRALRPRVLPTFVITSLAFVALSLVGAGTP
jgi:hypothetical protein